MTVAPGSLYRIALALKGVFTSAFWARMGRRPPGLGVPFEDLTRLALDVAEVRTGTLVFLGYAIWHLGNSLSLLLGVLAICALPVLSTLAGNALLFIGQGQEFLREYGVAFMPGDAGQGLQGVATLPLILVLPIWALTNWYCARQLLVQSFRVPRELGGFLPGYFGRLLKKYFPRLLGLASLLPIALAYAGISAPQSSAGWAGHAMLALAVVCLFDWVFHRDVGPRTFALAVLLAGIGLTGAGLAWLLASAGRDTRDWGWAVPAAYVLLLGGVLSLFELRRRAVFDNGATAHHLGLGRLGAWGAILAGLALFVIGRRHPEQLALWFLLAFAVCHGFMGWRRRLWPARFHSILRQTRRLREAMTPEAVARAHPNVGLLRRLAPGFLAHLVDVLAHGLDRAVADLRRRGVGLGTLAILSVLNIAAFSLTWGITRDPVQTGWTVRAIPIVLLALSGITLFGSLVLYLLPKALGLPSLVLVPVLLAVMAGQSVDNHGLPGVVPQHAARFPAPQRPALAEHFAAWRTQRGADVDKDFPIFIVAAAGGGHRASAWTAEVLSRLEDATCGAFSRHVYAISGVSGGSLGAASFVAALADERARGGSAPGPTCWNRSARSRHITAFHAADYISPVLAYMLFPDLMQRFWPEPVFAHDRAWALESTWERVWEATRPPGVAQPGANRFAQPFLALYAHPGEAGLPLLFFNATSVEDGKRVITSPVLTRHEDAYDLLAAELVTGDIRLATAVHNSARFTYVSPAGTVYRDAPAGRWGRVVDGGYFENSGTVTAREILEQLAALQGHRRNLHVILISNEPRDPARRICQSPRDEIPRARGSTSAPDKTPPPDRPLLPEMTAPLGALAATREARGALAEVDLVNAVGSCARVHEVYLARNRQLEFSDPALGWFLSSASLAGIDNALAASDDGAREQPARRELERIAARVLGLAPGDEADRTIAQLRQARLDVLCRRAGQNGCAP